MYPEVHSTINNNSSLTLLFLFTVIAATSLIITPNMIWAQLSTQSSSSSLPVTIAPDGTYVNELGFKVRVPSGFVVEDVDNMAPGQMLLEQMSGSALLAKLCQNPTPGLGGTNECQVTRGSGDVGIFGFRDLKSRPEVQSLILNQGKNITTQDILVMYTNLIKSGVASSNSEIAIGNNTDISPDRKYAEVGFQSIMGDYVKNIVLIVLSPDKNTAYALNSPGYFPTKDITLPEATKQIFDSFEVIPSTAMTNMTTGP